MLPNWLNVLLVEDNPGDARLIREMLTGAEYFDKAYTLAHVPSLQAAAQSCAREHFDVILLDMNLPDSLGLSTIQRVNTMAPEIPIIILTGMRDERLALEAVQHGAQDYISKDECTASLLKRTIHYAIERKRVQERFKHLAMHDSLTGLPNRDLFYDRLSQAIKHAQRNRMGMSNKWKTAVMLVDLDDFKHVNDSLGHAQGDAVLRLVARRLKFSLRESDTIARLAGDEFLLVLEGIATREDCTLISQKLLETLRKPLVLEGAEFRIQASIGVSIFPDDATDIETLIRYADTAMYAAKRQRIQVCFYKDLSGE